MSCSAWRTRRLRTWGLLSVTAWSLLLGVQAQARPYHIEDLLRLEALRGGGVDPNGRYLVLQVQRPYDQAARYDLDGAEGYALDRLMMVDLVHPGPARPLLKGRIGAGYRAGPFSPDGASMAFFRYWRGRWRLGTIRFASRRVRWFPGAPDLSALGVSVDWLSPTRLLVISRQDGTNPAPIRRPQLAMVRPAAGWAAVRSGRMSRFTVVGGGRYINDTPAAPLGALSDWNLETGRAQRRAVGRFEDLARSADGRFAAVIEGAERVQPKADSIVHLGDPYWRRRLRVIDLTSGQSSSPLDGMEVSASLLNWSPRGHRLLVLARAPGQDWAQARLLRLLAGEAGVADMSSSPGGPPLIQIDQDTGLVRVRTAWLDETPVVLRKASGEVPAGDWYLGAGQDARRLSPNGEVRPEAQGADWLWFRDREGLWAATPSGVVRLADKACRFEIARPLAQGWRTQLGPAPLASPPAIACPAAQAEATSGAGGAGRDGPRNAPEEAVIAYGRLRVVSRTTGRGSTVIEAIKRGGGRMALMRLNSPLDQVDTAPPQRILSPSGKASGWLYRPESARRRLSGSALIVLPYPGARHAQPPYAGRPDAEVLSNSVQLAVAHGYAVLIPDLDPTSPGEPLGASVADPIWDLVKGLADDGLVDPARVALWGHSYGGYGALAAAVRTDRFAAIVAANAPVDLASLRGAFSPQARAAPEEGLSPNNMAGWAETGQAGLHRTPWDDPDLYVRMSPVFFADRVKTPVLLITGDQDFVSQTQSEEMFSALWRLGRDVKLISFLGEGHVVTAPANILALYHQVFQFLDPILKPDGDDPGPRRQDLSRLSAIKKPVLVRAGP